MAASTTDKLIEVGGIGTATTLSAPGYTAGVSTSITVGSTSNWPTATRTIFAIDEAEVVGGVEVQVEGTYNEFSGIVATATSITDVEWVLGPGDRTYAAGALTRVYIPVSAERENQIVEWGLTHADQDGTLKAGAVDVAAVVADGILTAAKSTTATNIETRGSETIFDHVASGGVWSGDSYGSSLNASMTALVAYINGQRGTVSAVTARAFTASKDTYIDVLNSSGTFSLVYTEVANNAASPALAANSIRLGIIVSGANIASVAAVNQGQLDKVLPIASSIAYTTTDSLGNLICPRDPSRKVLGYRQIVASVNTTNTSVTQATGLSCPVIIPTGRKAKITFFATQLSSTAATGTNVAAIWSGTVGSGTRIAQQNDTITAANLATHINVTGAVTGTGSLVTYNAGYYHDSAGTHTITAGSDQAAYIMVELQ